MARKRSSKGEKKEKETGLPEVSENLKGCSNSSIAPNPIGHRIEKLVLHCKRAWQGLFKDRKQGGEGFYKKREAILKTHA